MEPAGFIVLEPTVGTVEPNSPRNFFSFINVGTITIRYSKNSNISAPEIRQMWHENGKRCPKGTVPIRRSSVHDVLRAKSLYDYGKKQRKYMPATARQVEPPNVVSRNAHEHAIAFTIRPSGVYGAKATINVWNPSIEAANEFSLAQIWVLSNSSDEDLNSIEAGWQVHPKLYGDNQPRLFIYWTFDIRRRAVSMGDHTFQLEGDCLSVITQLLQTTPSLSSIGGIIQEIKSLTSGRSFTFHHILRTCNKAAHLMAHDYRSDCEDITSFPFVNPDI